ncbi:MAG TPA: hypothetical protein ENH59_08180 [Bacteroidetes bacterium]|nr:hypothetical protein [Bacteroidota bacterium]
MYATVDMETTGGSPRNERITEIAIFIFDGKKIVDKFCSLVNPERDIPYFITSITGISNEMVEDAPRFYEIAKDIVEITEGKSKNIHRRVMTHLSNNSSKRAMQMRDEIADIDYELTGNELIALLKESEEIKKTSI